MTAWHVTEGDGFEVRFAAPDTAQYAAVVQRLVDDRVASRLAAHDASLWGPAAEAEAAKRLGWTDLHERTRALVPEILALRDEQRAQGLTRIVLCGMGGSSLAPEVICAADEAPLEMLDTSSPDVVRRAVEHGLDATVVVVSSKSGSTVETDSQRRIFEAAFRAAGINPAARIVVVTDPDSPLDREAQASGYRVFHADPTVGGRYSALSAFGLVPCGLAGADIAKLLDEAALLHPATVPDDVDNPVLRLGALLGLAVTRGVDKGVLANAGSRVTLLGNWAEQLIAESTGKDGTGLLPIAVPGTHAPNFVDSTRDCALLTWGPDSLLEEVPPASGFGASVRADLGAQFLLWEGAVAVAGRVLGINPFDQPDVESAKAAAREMLSGDVPEARPVLVDDRVAIYAGGWLPDTVTDARSALAALVATLDPETGYLAVHAYLDADQDTEAAQLREILARHTGRPVTFGWAPRFLHSTGQYHKGGPATGVYLQLTSDPEQDLAIPGRDFTLGQFQAAQAIGDARVLSDRGRPVLRLHLPSPDGVAGWISSLL